MATQVSKTSLGSPGSFPHCTNHRSRVYVTCLEEAITHLKEAVVIIDDARCQWRYIDTLNPNNNNKNRHLYSRSFPCMHIHISTYGGEISPIAFSTSSLHHRNGRQWSRGGPFPKQRHHSPDYYNSGNTSAPKMSLKLVCANSSVEAQG